MGSEPAWTLSQRETLSLLCWTTNRPALPSSGRHELHLSRMFTIQIFLKNIPKHRCFAPIHNMYEIWETQRDSSFNSGHLQTVSYIHTASCVCLGRVCWPWECWITCTGRLEMQRGWGPRKDSQCWHAYPCFITPQWDISEVCSIQFLSRTELQVPTIVIISLTYYLLASHFSMYHVPTPSLCSWHHIPNKPPALNFQSQRLVWENSYQGR